jgi:release factor glutamine methyltransferase
MTNFGKLSKLKEDASAETLPPPTIKLKSNIREDIPDAYLKGYVEFYKLKFKLTHNVLIPRPETELLVDEILKFSHLQPPTSNLTILDIGTGSGNIAISVTKNNKKIKVFATEVSKEALEIAKFNAKFHRVEDQIFFIESDLLEKFSPKGQIDVVVTNLPYIPTSRIPYLDPSVKDFEPRVALDGGYDGFGLYRKLFAQMVEKKLLPKLFIGEIDYTHGELAINEAQKYFPKAKTEVKTDLAHKQRILLINF